MRRRATGLGSSALIDRLASAAKRKRLASLAVGAAADLPLSPAARGLLVRAERLAIDERAVPALGHLMRALEDAHAGLFNGLAGVPGGRVKAMELATRGLWDRPLDVALELALKTRPHRPLVVSDFARAMLALVRGHLAERLARALRLRQEDRREIRVPSDDELEEMLDELTSPRGRPTRPASVSRVSTPILDKYGRDLTALARGGSLSSLVGRDFELRQVIEVLCRSVKRNPILVGPPGTGKTALVEGLAQRIVAGEVPRRLKGARLVEVSPQLIKTITQQSSDTASMIRGLISEAARSGAIIFLDEFHVATEIRYEGEATVAAQMKPALARGEFACIGATTEAEYLGIVQRDAAIDRRFERVQVNEPDRATTLAIVASTARGIAGSDESLVPTSAVLEEIVELAARYLPNRTFPDKAIDILDRAIARAQMAERPPDQQLVREVVADMTGLPIGEAGAGIVARLDTLAEQLNRTIVGQEHVVDDLVPALAAKLRNLDLRPERPNGVFLFTGPTGVGKTEMARALAAHLFGSSDRFVRLDMSEYAAADSLPRLIGAAPGLVGFREVPPLIKEVASRPFTVVLLDEMEKAHPAVHRLFLQVFDAGVLTTSWGGRVYFSDAVIVMTANIQADTRHAVGFAGASSEASAMLDALGSYFPPEFIGRIDAVLPFRVLAKVDVRRILTGILLPEVTARLARGGITLGIDEELIGHLAGRGYTRELGARALQHAVEDELIGAIAMQVRGPGPHHVHASLCGDEVILEVSDPAAAS